MARGTSSFTAERTGSQGSFSWVSRVESFFMSRISSLSSKRSRFLLGTTPEGFLLIGDPLLLHDEIPRANSVLREITR